MKSFPFAALLVAVLLASTAASPPPKFFRWSMNLHVLGGLVATVGSIKNTGDCWNAPFGYKCTMMHDQQAWLYFKTKDDKECMVNVRREGNTFEGRWDVFLYHGPCKVHKLGDNDYGVAPKP